MDPRRGKNKMCLRYMKSKDLQEEMATGSCSCLENSAYRRAWWPTAHGVTKSQTGLRD